MANPEPKVKLLGLWVSPFVRRVEWALKLKGISYDYVEEDITRKSSLLLELNPVHKRVPVMVHGGKVVAESLVILEYIDEIWRHNLLLPQHPHERATARFWTMAIETKLLENAWIAMCTEGKEKERAVSLAIEAMEYVEGFLEGKTFCAGESVGYLDLTMGWISLWLPVWEEVGSMKICDPEKFPNTVAWMSRFLDHPVIADNLPPRDKMVAYYGRKRGLIMASWAQG